MVGRALRCAPFFSLHSYSPAARSGVRALLGVEHFAENPLSGAPISLTPRLQRGGSASETIGTASAVSSPCHLWRPILVANHFHQTNNGFLPTRGSILIYEQDDSAATGHGIANGTSSSLIDMPTELFHFPTINEDISLSKSIQSRRISML